MTQRGIRSWPSPLPQAEQGDSGDGDDAVHGTDYGLDNPRSGVIFGGLMGTTSGVAGGLAATDPELVPYGCLTAAFYTALTCCSRNSLPMSL